MVFVLFMFSLYTTPFSSMSRLAPAQCPPELVITRTISCLLQTLAKSPPRYMIVSSLAYAKCPSLLPLLQVCQAWRNVAAKEFYKHASIFLGLKWDLRAICLQTPTIELAAEESVLRFVKQVTIRVRFDCIFDGRAADLLCSLPFSNITFPNVTQISIQAKGCPHLTPYGSEGALLFCKRVMEIFPYAVPNRQGELALWVDVRRWHNDVKYDRHRPLQHFTRYHTFKECLSIAAKPTASLTSISLGGEMFDVPHVELVQRNAQTLRSICLRQISHDLCSLLVQDKDAAIPHVYPDVQHLELHVVVSSNFANYSRYAPAGSPFPRLRKLVCKPFYPFSNDVLFRGNGMTLESLVLPVDYMVADALKNSSIQTESCISLDYVHIPVFWPQDISFHRQQSDTMRGSMLQTALHIAQHCTSLVLGLNGDFLYSQLHTSFEQFHGFSRLCTFDISSMWISPREALRMIQHMPTVRRVYVSLLCDGTESREHMVLRAIERAYGAFKSTPSSHLHSLHVMRVERYTRWQLVERLLIVASLVPTVKHMSVHTAIEGSMVERVRCELVPEIPWACLHVNQVDIHCK